METLNRQHDMISVEPTRDREWLWEVATHPAIFEKIGGSASTNRSAVLESVDKPQNFFLKAIIDGKPMGFFAFHWLADRMAFDLHICILPNFRGVDALTAFRMAIAWIFEATIAKSILAVFQNSRKDVKIFITKAGFKWQCFDGEIAHYKLERMDLCLG